MIGAGLGAAAVLTVAGISSAAVDTQTYSSVAQKNKQDTKVRGPLGPFTTNLDTLFSGPGPAGVMPPATQTVLAFDSDFRFDPGKIPQCNVVSLVGKDSAGAKAACPNSIVGQGSAVIKEALGGNLSAVVTAFNGVRSGGNPIILLHLDIQGSTTKPILTGTLRSNTLTVQVPVTPAAAITHIDTTINQVVSKKKKNKRTGKTTRFYYVSAKCSDGHWQHTETTTFTDGTTKSASFSQPCKRKSKK
jgi:hypothetical protein